MVRITSALRLSHSNYPFSKIRPFNNNNGTLQKLLKRGQLMYFKKMIAYINMSLQISPWSTHQKNFKIDWKKKIAKLSPLRQSRLKKQNVSHPIIEPQKLALTKEEPIIQRQISERQSQQQYEKYELQNNFPPDLRREQQRIYQEMQETLVLKIIRDKIELQSALSFLLPSIKQRKREDPAAKIKKISLNQIRVKRDLSITPVLSTRREKDKQIDNQSKALPINTNPFDDRKIIEKGLSSLKSREYTLKRNVDSVNLRIKGL